MRKALLFRIEIPGTKWQKMEVSPMIKTSSGTPAQMLAEFIEHKLKGISTGIKVDFVRDITDEDHY